LLQTLVAPRKGVQPVDPLSKPMGMGTRDRLRRLAEEDSPDLRTITDTSGVFRFVSAASMPLFGWDPDGLVGLHQDTLVHPDDAGLVDSARHRVSEIAPSTVTTVYRFRCADGAYRWTEAVSWLVEREGEPLVVSAIRDIGVRKQSEIDLMRQATTDWLTGTANRAVFMDRLQQALRRMQRRPGLVVVLFLDLDQFKRINDSVGHLVGDAVLLKMAERLRRFLRPQDTLARWGGDEFAIVVEGFSDPDEAVALGSRVIEAGRVPFRVGKDEFICTTSVGIAMTTDPDHSAESLLQEADMALYRAKDRGRDRAELFDDDLRARAVGRLSTERMLRRAIDEERLRVNYQPIIDLRTGDTVAAEALVRVWNAERETLIVAGSFIAIAEESDLLVEIDDWVLGRAIGQAAIWRPLFEGTGFEDISINLTSRHLADVGFTQSVLDDLAAHDLPTASLQIEVTERVLMEASNSVMTGLKLLRDAGVRVGLDDFGTGYSSLSYLCQFPLDFVKIDRSFIHMVARGDTERAIVTSIIDLAHALEMNVVAEGVETQAQLDELVAMGCDRAQGVLFAPAGPPDVTEHRVLARTEVPARTRGPRKSGHLRAVLQPRLSDPDPV
jgi:diguanylate cyclase (GGDEF)-like protein/PAS domain S-box-containing protein